MKLLAKAIIHEWEDKDYAPEKTVKEVMAEMCPPKMKKKVTNLKIQESKWTSTGRNLKKYPPSHILLKFLKIKGKDKVLGKAIEKGYRTLGKINLNDREILISNQRRQRKIAQHFSSAKIKIIVNTELYAKWK